MYYDHIYEARFAARYAARFNERTGRAWKKLSTLISGVELLAGSTAFGAYLSDNAQLAGYTALLLALCVAINHTLHPGDKAKDEDQLFISFMKLAGDQELSLKDFNQKLTDLSSVPAHGFEAIRPVAYNDVANEFGRPDYLFKLSCWQRFMSLLA